MIEMTVLKTLTFRSILNFLHQLHTCVSSIIYHLPPKKSIRHNPTNIAHITTGIDADRTYL